MKKIFAVITALILVTFTLSSCSTSSASKSVKSPQECIEAYYNLIIEENYELAYTTYYSTVSKTFKTKEEFIEENETKVFEDSRKLIGVLVNSTDKIENIEENVFLVEGLLKYSDNGSEVTENFSDYVIKQKEDGFYRYLYNGILSNKSYSMAATHDSNLVHADSLKMYDSIKGLYAEYHFVNETGKRYQFGNKDGFKVQLTVDDKIEACNVSESVLLDAKGETTIKGFFENVHGTPTNITVTNVFQIGNDGSILNANKGQTYSVKIT